MSSAKLTLPQFSRCPTVRAIVIHGELSPRAIWMLAALVLGCICSVIVGFNLTLGTRRRLGLYFIWIAVAILVASTTAVVLLLTHR